MLGRRVKKFTTPIDELKKPVPTLWDIYYEAIKPFRDRTSEINQKYGCKSDPARTPEDERAWNHAREMENKVWDEMTVQHPPVPCPGCGIPLSQILGMHCTNFQDDCPLALPVGG